MNPRRKCRANGWTHARGERDAADELGDDCARALGSPEPRWPPEAWRQPRSRPQAPAVVESPLQDLLQLWAMRKPTGTPCELVPSDAQSSAEYEPTGRFVGTFTVTLAKL